MAIVDLKALLHAAGASLGDAQGQLLTGVDASPTVMAIAEATLDMKVTIDGTARSALQVVPVSAAALPRGNGASLTRSGPARAPTLRGSSPRERPAVRRSPLLRPPQRSRRWYVRRRSRLPSRHRRRRQRQPPWPQRRPRQPQPQQRDPDAAGGASPETFGARGNQPCGASNDTGHAEARYRARGAAATKRALDLTAFEDRQSHLGDAIDRRRQAAARSSRYGPGVPARGSTPGDQLVAAMAAKLDAARAEDRATIAALEARLTAVTAQVADLKSQAADLAAGAAAASGDHSAELHDALTVTDRLLAELALSKASGQAVTADLAASKASLVRVQREVGDLRAAVDPKATGAAVLGPETAAALLNDFVGSFTSNLTGLGVASGEVSLKTAFAQFGKGAGFVLPTAHTPAGELPLLHEITLRLDTRG